tara:strand:+ start:32399 stop:33595 length:1197 start_codon:yes stop_codon:yes gene_type:complete
MEEITTENNLDTLRCCVIIPTFNNHKTLDKTIKGVLSHTQNIIIINDGSTDSTAAILANYPNLEQLHFRKNKGKGQALRAGFKLAETKGYHYAITIDSDGQHFTEDIPVFVDALKNESNKNTLFIGARNMTQESVPKKSSFGNTFSNFWFWVETGVKLQDTQSGFRLYPIHQLKNINYYTSKFEFEIEVIVKASWSGTVVKNIPIRVLYDEAERVSHFRPFKDFTRISILNTWLVIVTFLYIKPRELYRTFKKKGVKLFITENFLGSNDAPLKKSLSVALGVFIGLSPLWGLQTIIVLFLALVLKLNRTIAFAFSNISLPPFIPFIVYAGIKLGDFILGQNSTTENIEIVLSFEALKNIKAYIIGSIVLAIIGALLFGLLSYLLFLIFQKKKVIAANA